MSGCKFCPLGPSAKIVKGCGAGGGLAVVGEAPGNSEVLKGKPFIGVSGQLLRSTLQAFNIDPETVYYTNSVLCHTVGKPSNDAIMACNARLLEELSDASPKRILAVGATALQALRGLPKSVSITSHRGRGFYTDLNKKVYTVSTYHPAAVLRDVDLFRDFSRDIEKLLTTPGVINDAGQKPETIICWTPEYALQWLEAFETAGTISCDIETTGLDIVDDGLLSVGLAASTDTRDLCSVTAIILPEPVLRVEPVRIKLVSLLESPPRKVIFHNGKFDNHWLTRLAGRPIDYYSLQDTMLMSYGLDERPMSRYKSHGLKDLARLYFDAEDYAFDFRKLSDTETVWNVSDYETLFRYQALDCAYTLLLYYALSERMADQRYEFNELWRRVLRPASVALTDIEDYGIKIDTEYLTSLSEASRKAADRLLDTIVTDVCTLTRWDDYNPGSPIQVRKLIYEFWKLPVILDPANRDQLEPTSRLTLERLAEAATDPVCARILRAHVEWRQVSKLNNTYVEGLLKSVASDGRIHPNFLLHGTSTGRLSCNSPNLQNIPTAHSGSPIPRAFIADDGYTLLSADYSQLELRVAAYYSADSKLRDIFLRGADIHSETAEILFDKPASQISGAERTLTKAVVFGIIYGRGPKAIIEGKEMHYLVSELGGKRWTLPQAQTFLTKFLNTYPDLRDWLVKMHAEAFTTHYVSTPLGRRRRFPLILPQIKSEIGRQAANMPIQSLASDITLLALIRLHSYFQNFAEPRPRVLLTIHDSILFEIPSAQLVHWQLHIVASMKDVQLNTDLPFPVSVKIGPTWGDLV